MADVTVRLNGRESDKYRSRREELDAKLTGAPGFADEYARSDTDDEPRVELAASADLQTRFGSFRIFGFRDHSDGKEHTAIVQGEVNERSDVPVRVHSQCHTGDVWGSLRCDCRDQLEAAIHYIAGSEYGAVIYLKQEGRGIGLINKLKAYRLQELGLDTVEANHYLGFPAEARDYAVAKEIIDLLGIRSIALLSNNPDKIEKLRSEGVVITRRIPIVVEPNRHNRHYLDTKRTKMGHLI
jgi:GTP cyclohydrolase II